MANPAASYDLIADFKLAMRVTTNANDDIIQGELNAAARMIDRCCRRTFWPGAGTVRVFDAPRGSIIKAIDHRAITGITVYGVALAPADFRSLKLDSAQPAYQFLERTIGGVPADWHQDHTLSPYGAIVATGDWGVEPTVPIDVVMANRMVGSRLLKKRGLLYLGSGGNEELSSIGDSGALIDNDVLELIGWLCLPDLPTLMGD